MDDRDKATSTIPEPPAQEFIKKADNRDKVMRAVQVAVLFFVVILSSYSAISLRQIVIQNNTNAIERAAQIERNSDEQKNYIKCLALLQFDVPKKQLTTRTGAVKALDKCAVQTGTKN